MNIAFKATAATIVSFAFVTVSFFSVPAHAQNVADLQAQISQLQTLIAQLQGGSSSSATVAVSTSAACPYAWSRNLVIGSTGEDVRQLQRFLNSDAATRVASSGVGSAGSESAYYGPATADAVKRFQEKYASTILQPLGLSQGTGNFYPSTRTKANELCSKATGVSVISDPSVKTPPVTRNPGVTVQGNGIAATKGEQIGDGYAVLGAQRVPYTNFSLTAGSRDVVVNGVNVGIVGLASRDALESIALVDSNGIQLGSARGLNSRNEARIGGTFEVPAGQTVSLTVVGNVSTEDDKVKGVAGLEVLSIVTDAPVQGVSATSPIRGASHVFSDSLELVTVTVTGEGTGSDVEINEPNEEVAKFNIDLGTGGDKEDAYLKSITFEQDGTIDASDMSRLVVIVDNDDDEKYSLIPQAGDRYIVVFPGSGILIEEGEDVDLTLEATLRDGVDETIQFNIDDMSDVYVVGKTYGYGLAVSVRESAGSRAVSYDVVAGTIGSGTGSRPGEYESEDFEISYGDDRLLAAEDFEITGENVIFEELIFNVLVSGLGSKTADDKFSKDEDIDELTIDSIELLVDGKRVGFADEDITLDAEDLGLAGDTEVALTATVEFPDEFIVRPDEDEDITFEIRGDLSDDWSSFDGAEIEFTWATAETVEGEVSEKDYQAEIGLEDKDGNATTIEFTNVEIVGNLVEFELNDDNVDDSQVVAGSSEVVFGTLAIDTSDAIDDVRLEFIELTATADPVDGPDNGNTEGDSEEHDLDNLRDCGLFEGDDRVADTRRGSGTSHQYRFDFDSRYTVEAGLRNDFELELRCNIRDGVFAGTTYQFAFAAADEVEYRIAGDDRTQNGDGSDSETIVITGAGQLRVSVDNPGDDGEYVLAVGADGEDGVRVLEYTLEARREAVEIKNVYLTGVTVLSTSGTTVEDVLSDMTLTLGGTDVDSLTVAAQTINSVPEQLVYSCLKM